MEVDDADRHAMQIQRKTEASVLILDMIDFKTKNTSRIKEGHFIMIKIWLAKKI